MVRSILKAVLILILALGAPLDAQHKTTLLLEPLEDAELQTRIEQGVSGFLTELNAACKQERKPRFDGEQVLPAAIGKIEALWKTAPFFCAETELIARLITLGDEGYEIRNVPLIVELADGEKHFEEGVIELNGEGRIEDLYYGLELHRYNQLLRENTSLTDFRRRQIILNFVENFRTAYNRKDIEFLGQVFSDNALIIVGRLLRRGESRMLEDNLEQAKVELIRLNKQEYINNLKRVFERNQFIKVGFDEISIVQHRLYPDFYGVTLKQQWQSNTYSDKGYLFLMVDFRDEDHPVIHVRSWQPDQFTDESDVISLGDFEIIE